MLVMLTDVKGKERWINAAYVKSVAEKSGKSEIEVSGWAMKFKVEMPAAQVAQILNEAMPDLASMLAPLDDDAVSQQQAQSGGAVGGMLG